MCVHYLTQLLGSREFVILKNFRVASHQYWKQLEVEFSTNFIHLFIYSSFFVISWYQIVYNSKAWCSIMILSKMSNQRQLAHFLVKYMKYVKLPKWHQWKIWNATLKFIETNVYQRVSNQLSESHSANTCVAKSTWAVSRLCQI